MTTWKKQKLSGLGSLSRGKSKHRPRNDSSLYGGKYPFVQTADVKHANFRINSYSQTYNEKGLAQSKLWPKDTLCITIAANIAENAILGFPACFPDSVVGFIADDNKSDVYFVKYALDFAKQSFKDIAQGAAQDNLSIEKIEKLTLPVPDLPAQQKIASILSTYDDLIEINEKRIKILEEMAQRLYTEWFVKFRFPGHEKVKLINSHTTFGMIPEGWDVKDLGEIAKVIYGYNFKSEYFTSNSEGYILIRIRDILSGESDTHSTQKNVSDDYKTKEGDLLIGMDGIFHMNIWNTEGQYIVQRVAGIRSEIPSLYLKIAIKPQLKRLQETITGSTVGHLSNGNIKDFKILVPNNTNILKLFKDSQSEIIAMKKINTQLSTMRNQLIPQLITGKREVK